jgi:hypothetical protein
VIWECFGVDDSISKDFRVLITNDQNKSLKCLLYDMKNWGSSIEIKFETKKNLYERILTLNSRIPLHIISTLDFKKTLKANFIEIIASWCGYLNEKLYLVMDGKFLSKEIEKEKASNIFKNKESEIEFYGEDLTFIFNNSNSDQNAFRIEGSIYVVAYILKTDTIGESIKVKKNCVFFSPFFIASSI